MFYDNYLLIKTKLNNNGVNMPKPIQFKKLLLLMLLFSSSMNVFSNSYVENKWLDNRYVDHKNGTVTDKITGLMWKQCSEGLSLSGSNCVNEEGKEDNPTLYSWKQAIELTNTFEFAGKSDWRLPNIKELMSLVARNRRSGSSINSTRFPNTPTDAYWSSSPSARHSQSSWKVTFNGGYHIYSPRHRDSKAYVRLVRDVK
jgi:aryl carrier-like protein